MRFFSIVVLTVTTFVACVGSSSVATPSHITEPDFPTHVQFPNQKDVDHKRLLRTYQATGNEVEDRANFFIDAITAGKLKFRASQLGNNVEAALQSSNLEKLRKHVDKLNRGKDSSKQISVVGILIGKYGDDAVIQALVSAKQAGDMNSVVTKLETELFTGWMKNRQFPENVFSKLKISDEGDITLRIGKIDVLNKYLTFFNRKVDKKDSFLNVMSKGFRTENNALSFLGEAKKNHLTMKKATEFETTLLLQKMEVEVAKIGGLDKLANALPKLDDHVKSLKLTYGNNDISLIKTLLAKYSDVRVAKMLEKAKSGDEKDIATKLQTEQFQTWLKDDKSIDDVYKLLKLDDYGETIMLSRALDTLESYTTFFNDGKPIKESFIKIISSHFGGDDKFALKLLGFKGLESSREKAIDLQTKLFQQWKDEGLDSVSVLNKVFKVRKIEKTTDGGILLTAEEFKNFLRNTVTTPRML